MDVGRNHGDAAIDSVEFRLFAVSFRGGVSHVFAYRHPNAVKPIAPFQVVRPLGVRFLFSIDEDVIWFDPAIGRKNDRAIAKAALGLHSFGEIDLPVHWGLPHFRYHQRYHSMSSITKQNNWRREWDSNPR